MKFVAVDERGRRVGESHPRARLTDHEVELIRQLAEGEMVRNPATGRFEKRRGLTYAEIAAKFDISVETAKSIGQYRRRATTVAKLKRVREATDPPAVQKSRGPTMRWPELGAGPEALAEAPVPAADPAPAVRAVRWLLRNGHKVAGRKLKRVR